MRLALAVREGRISPVFDVSKRLLVLEIERGRVVSREERELVEDGLLHKADQLERFGVETLVCGAVSQTMASLVASRGIDVIPFVAGVTEEVADAFLAGDLPNSRMAMPGWCNRWGDGRRRRRRGGAGGNCVCMECGHKEPHLRGEPCIQKGCPKCGAILTRE